MYNGMTKQGTLFSYHSSLSIGPLIMWVLSIFGDIGDIIEAISKFNSSLYIINIPKIHGFNLYQQYLIMKKNPFLNSNYTTFMEKMTNLLREKLLEK